MYAGAPRTVLFAQVIEPNSSLTYYWDKETGALVAFSGTIYGAYVSALVSSTNLWSAHEPETGLASNLIVLSVITMLSLMAYAALLRISGGAVHAIGHLRVRPGQLGPWVTTSPCSR